MPCHRNPHLKRSCLSTRSTTSPYATHVLRDSPHGHADTGQGQPLPPHPPAQEQSRGADAAGTPHPRPPVFLPRLPSQTPQTGRGYLGRLVPEPAQTKLTSRNNKAHLVTGRTAFICHFHLQRKGAKGHMTGTSARNVSNLSHGQRELISCRRCPGGQGSLMMHFVPENQTRAHANTWQPFSSSKTKRISARRRQRATCRHSLSVKPGDSGARTPTSKNPGTRVLLHVTSGGCGSHRPHGPSVNSPSPPPSGVDAVSASDRRPRASGQTNPSGPPALRRWRPHLPAPAVWGTRGDQLPVWPPPTSCSVSFPSLLPLGTFGI